MKYDGPSFVIVDDDHSRAIDRYRPIGKAKGKYPIDLQLSYTPRNALGLLEHLTSVGQPIGGVLVDFDLNVSRPVEEQIRKRVSVTDSTGQTYPVSTGVGVLDWTFRNLPGVPTWAIIDTSAPHSPLYASAARLWFDSNPMDVGRFSAEGFPELVAELENPIAARRKGMWPAIHHTSILFEHLINQRLQKVEPLDWLAALATLPRRYRKGGGFTDLLEECVEEIAGQPVPVYRNRLCLLMARSQRLLREIYEPDVFSISDAVMKWEQWPDVDEDELRRDEALQHIQHWKDFNPFTEVFGAQIECVRFLTSPDVRAALRHYRERVTAPGSGT